MSKLQTPFRYDFVGSFLRPQALKDAKALYQEGKITKTEYDFQLSVTFSGSSELWGGATNVR